MGAVSKLRKPPEPQALLDYKARLADLHERMGKLRHCRLDDLNTARKFTPIRFAGLTFDENVQRVALEKAVAVCAEYCPYDDGWLYLYGPPGAGKSHLAAAILNKLAEEQVEAILDDPDNGHFRYDYVSVPNLLQYIRQGFNDKTAGKRLDELCTVNFLVMDDLGTEKTTEWGDEQLFTIINERDKHNRETIFTSNVEFDSLAPRIADRIAGQVGEDGLLLMPISSYRRLRA